MAIKLDRKFQIRPRMEGSWGVSAPLTEGLVEMQLSLTIFEDEDRGYAEMFIPSIDEYVEIGLIFDAGALVDYDGIMSIPDQLLDMLDELGFNTSEMREQD